MVTLGTYEIEKMHKLHKISFFFGGVKSKLIEKNIK